MSEEPKYLLESAEDHIDEEEGMTLQEIMEMLAQDLGYTLTKKEAPDGRT